mmetsp:Transcript_24449/g.28167  ORF Transcript_24449/g.28167 Transcript_24449/m.28167 type:complete len:110 (-) Transcript_24449:397-726(-)
MNVFFALVSILCFATISAFAPSSNVQVPRKFSITDRPSFHTPRSSRINMGFGQPDEDSKPITRDNEPEEFFQTDTDKMSDAEKLPIALGGLAAISLPFILGMIALYAAK